MAWPPTPSRAGDAYAATAATGLRPVPLFMRWLWLAGLVAAIPTGISLLFAAFNGNVDREGGAIMSAFGVGTLLFGVLCLVKTCQGTFRNWWRYAFRWVFMLACVQTILVSAFILGSTNSSSDGQVACIFFIVMPAVLLPIMLFVRFSKPQAQALPAAGAGPSADAGPRPATPSLEANAARPAAAGFAGPPYAAPHRRRRRTKHRPEQSQGSLIGRFFGFVRDTTVGGIIAGLLLLAALAAGWVAMDVSGMLAAGLPAPQIPADLTRNLGTDRWPQMFRAGAYAVGWVSLLMAAAVLIVARRRTYGLHMLRGVVGVGVFGLSLFLLAQSTRHAVWLRSADVAAFEDRMIELEGDHPADTIAHVGHGPGRDNRMDAAVERYFRGVETRQMVMANVVSLLSLLVLCWPARKAGVAGRAVRPYGPGPFDPYPPQPAARPAEQPMAPAPQAAAAPQPE
jgi:hypothetical protein